MFTISIQDRLELRIRRLRRTLARVNSHGAPSGIKRVIDRALTEDLQAEQRLSAEDAETIRERKYFLAGEAILDRKSAAPLRAGSNPMPPGPRPTLDPQNFAQEIAPVAEVSRIVWGTRPSFHSHIEIFWHNSELPLVGTKLYAEQPVHTFKGVPFQIAPKPAFWRCVRYPTGKNIPLAFMQVDVYNELDRLKYEQFGCVMEPYYRGAPNPALDTMDTERVNQFVYCLDNLSRMLVSLSSDMRAGRKPKKIDFPIDE